VLLLKGVRTLYTNESKKMMLSSLSQSSEKTSGNEMLKAPLEMIIYNQESELFRV